MMMAARMAIVTGTARGTKDGSLLRRASLILWPRGRCSLVPPCPCRRPCPSGGDTIVVSSKAPSIGCSFHRTFFALVAVHQKSNNRVMVKMRVSGKAAGNVLLACPGCVRRLREELRPLMSGGYSSRLFHWSTDHCNCCTSSLWPMCGFCGRRKSGSATARWYSYMKILSRAFEGPVMPDFRALEPGW